MLLIFTSCAHSKKVVYFSDLSDTARILTQDSIVRSRTTIRSGDILDIYVTSMSAEASAVFNLGNVSPGPSVAMSGSATASPYSGDVAGTTSARGYLVSEDGNIDYPFLGKLKVTGYTLGQLRDTMLARLDTLLRSPSVNIRFLNFKVTVLGEVNRPSTYVVGSGNISILDLLGMAGDLTIYGRREDILVVRDEGGKRTFARLDLTSSKVFNSPYYFLKQNDVVYVEPNKSKVATSNDKLLRTLSISASIVGLVVSLLLLTKL